MRTRTLALLVLSVFAFVLLGTTPADAHAYLVRSNPGDGMDLTHAPKELRFDLSEAVVLGATRVELVMGNGTGIRLGAPEILDAPDEADGDSSEGKEPEGEEPPMTLVVPIRDAVPKGSYRITWETLSADDLHRTSGVITFGVGQSVAAAGHSEPPIPLQDSAFGWLVLLGAAMSVGPEVIRSRRDRRDPFPSTMDRVATLAAATAAALAVGHLMLESRASSESVGQLLGSAYGARWGVREAGLIMLAVCAAMRIRRGRSYLAATVVAASTFAVGSALMGHSGVAPIEPTRFAAESTHVLAAMIWIGGLITLVVLAVTALRHGERGPVVEALRGFAGPAVVSVIALTVTGVWLASTAVASVDAALTTSYGRVLLVKVAVAAAAGLLGWHHHRAVRRGRGRVPRSLAVEAALLVAVLGGSAILATAAPATTPDLMDGAAVRGSVAADAVAADLQLHLAVTPNRPGAAIAMIGVFDTRRPLPPRPGSVTVDYLSGDGATRVRAAADRLPDNQWSAPLTLAQSGPVKLHIVVRRVGMPPAEVTMNWVVAPATAAPQPVLSRSPIREPLRWSAVGLIGTAALVGSGVLLRRRSTAADSDQSQSAADQEFVP